MTVNLANVDLDVPCPACGFGMFVLISEVQAQTYVRCPCCRVLVHLLDRDASTHVAARQIDQVLRQAFDGWGG